MKEASGYIPDPSDDLNREPGNQQVDTTTPKKVNKELTTIYMNKEIVIMKSKIGEFIVFYYGNLDKKELLPYAEVARTYIGKDEDGEPQFDYDEDSIEIDGGVIDGYVNDNIKSLSKGEGVDSFENGDDLVKIDSNVASELVRTYHSDKLAQLFGLQQNETTVAGASGGGLFGGGSSGPFVGPLNASPVKRKIEGIEEAKMIKKDGSAVKMRRKKYHYKESDSKTRRCKLCEFYNKGKCRKIWGAVGPNYVCDAFETKDIEETTTAASSGSYVTPKVWAKGKGDWANAKKTMYPGGKIVEALRKLAENNQNATSYPDGEFVDFDDCTKLNNNKEAENGGCSTGAVDGVVKTKKTKDSVISKDGKYNRGD